MYVDLHTALDDTRLTELRARLACLDLTRGAASYISPSAETRGAFEGALKDLFPGVWTGAGVVVLQPSQQLVAHRDPPIVGVRTHIPLVLNDQCWVFHDGAWRQLEEGHLYQMDPTDWHGAVNWGSTPRVHLMVDVVGGYRPEGSTV